MASTGLNLSNYDPMIKVHYAPGPVTNMAFQKNKAIGLMAKRNRKPSGNGGGKFWFQPLQIAFPGGDSSDFATAMAASNNASQFAGFSVTRKKHYRLAKVDNETIEATADGDMDAFEPAFDEFDRNIEAEGNYLNFRFFRSSGGYIGRMTTSGGGLAGTTLSFDDPSAVWALVKGDVINLASTDGTTGAIRAGSLAIAAVQRKAGTATVVGNISTGIPAAAQNDYVFKAGDFGLAASGLADWCPDNDPTNTPFYGQDRSIEPEFLGGTRTVATGGTPVHEVLIDQVVALDNIGAEPDVAFAHPNTLGSLSKQLEGKWVIVKGQGYNGEEADIGYKGWQVTLEGHEVVLFSDRTCQTKRLWMTQMDTWTMFSAGVMPGFLQKRAASILKVSENSDGYEARVGGYFNFSNKAPGYTNNGQLS